MNTKSNKSMTIIATICTIIPLNILIVRSMTANFTLSYSLMIIGFIVYLVQYKNYSNKQKKMLNIAICISIINLLSGFWIFYIDTETNNSFHIGWDTIIICSLFYISYLLYRIALLILCIKEFKNDLSKIKTFFIITIVIIFIIFLPDILTPHNYSEITGKIVFGNNYCNESHYKGEFDRNTPWKCRLCGHSTDTINPNKNVPIICYACSLITDRCMECGLLEKD